jgi:glycogen synthase
MIASMAYALRTYEEPPRWREMQFRAMQREAGRANAARRYIACYEELVGRTASRRRADRDGANEP